MKLLIDTLPITIFVIFAATFWYLRRKRRQNLSLLPIADPGETTTIDGKRYDRWMICSGYYDLYLLHMKPPRFLCKFYEEGVNYDEDKKEFIEVDENNISGFHYKHKNDNIYFDFVWFDVEPLNNDKIKLLEEIPKVI